VPISRTELYSFVATDFVECGSANGDGITAALEAGFKKIHSIEINPDKYRYCQHKFNFDPKVSLHLGDCGDLLDGILNEIADPCVIYLDANGDPKETRSPFHSSIAAILRAGRKEDVVIVDDMNHGFRPRYEIMGDLRNQLKEGSEECIIRQLKMVNEDYNFYMMDSHSADLVHTYPSWILIADPIKGRFKYQEYV